MRLRLAVVHYRSDDLAELDEFLDSPLDVDTLSLEARVQIAYLYEARNLGLKALEVMYQTRRRFFKDGQAHLKYIGFVFQKQKDAERLLDVGKVEVDTAVCVQDDSNQRQWYVIENREESDLSRGELRLEHPLAGKLLGKCLEDQVLLKETEFGKQYGKIIGIKSKYVHAFQESLSLFPKLFPETPGLIGVQIRPAQKNGEVPTGFQPILDEVTRRHGRDLELQQFYRGGLLTIGAFANAVSRNVLEVWAGLMSKPDLGVKCSVGNPAESSDALALLLGKPRLVVGVISLMTLHGIDAGDVVLKAFGPPGVAQSTIDFLAETVQERKGTWSRGFMMLGKEGDKFVRQKITPEDVKRNVEYLEGILKWVQDNCEVIPCRPALDMKAKDKEELNELTGALFADTILIAGEPGNVLYSDDERLRSFAKAELNVGGVWTQAVLMHCLNTRLLDKTTYSEMVVKLVCSHYHHTGVDADILVQAAKQSNWSLCSPYTDVVSALSGRSCDDESAIKVGANFLYELWKQPILAHHRDYLILSLLDSITAARKRGPVLAKLAAQVRGRFSLLPLAERRVMELIDTWKQVHII
jgi:hypothetical protein